MQTTTKKVILFNVNNMIYGRLFDWVLEKREKQKKFERNKTDIKKL